MTIFKKTKEQRELVGLANPNIPQKLSSQELIQYYLIFQKSLLALIEDHESGDLTEFSRRLASMVFDLHGLASHSGIPFDAILHEVHKERMSRIENINDSELSEKLIFDRLRNNSGGIISTLINNKKVDYKTNWREINLVNLINFFDEITPHNKGHTNAIVSVLGEELGANLFLKYKDWYGGNSQTQILNEPCVPGTKEGNRLDCWIFEKKDDAEILYQTEIKNWSAHSVDGKIYPINENQITDYRRNRWERIYDNESKRFRTDNLNKVLLPMKSPRENVKEIKPLLIVWDSMHPDGLNEPFFKCPVESDFFQEVYVFSMSTFIRIQIARGIKEIDLDLKKTLIRMQWLNKIYEIISFDEP
jgi:hypothetical protein